MTCRFSNLEFGEIVRLSGGQSCCAECGFDNQSMLEENEWMYVGHSGSLDMFQATKLLYCPSCGTRISGHGERCGDAENYSRIFTTKSQPISSGETS